MTASASAFAIACSLSTTTTIPSDSTVVNELSLASATVMTSPQSQSPEGGAIPTADSAIDLTAAVKPSTVVPTTPSKEDRHSPQTQPAEGDTPLATNSAADLDAAGNPAAHLTTSPSKPNLPLASPQQVHEDFNPEPNHAGLSSVTAIRGSESALSQFSAEPSSREWDLLPHEDDASVAIMPAGPAVNPDQTHHLNMGVSMADIAAEMPMPAYDPGIAHDFENGYLDFGAPLAAYATPQSNWLGLSPEDVVAAGGLGGYPINEPVMNVAPHVGINEEDGAIDFVGDVFAPRVVSDMKFLCTYTHNIMLLQDSQNIASIKTGVWRKSY